MGGENRVNLLSVYAPWALAFCDREFLVDAICCAMAPSDAGAATLVPITPAHNLKACRHYIAGIQPGAAVKCSGDDIESFYGRLGVELLGTETNGDCAFDTMLIMNNDPQTDEARVNLRKDRAAWAAWASLAFCGWCC